LLFLSELLDAAQRRCRDFFVVSTTAASDDDGQDDDGHDDSERVRRRRRQQQQQSLSASATAASTANAASSVVVHAFADPAYGRSSFHLAGPADQVAAVAGQLAGAAIRSLLVLHQEQQQEQEEEEITFSPNDTEDTSHPSVGLVDHVAVMPLVGRDDVCDDNNGVVSGDAGTAAAAAADDGGNFQPATPSGWAARRIGEEMMTTMARSNNNDDGNENGGGGTTSNLRVYYYGSAHPRGKPLADVRREQTRFFRRPSGGMRRRRGEGGGGDGQQQQVATVGAPPNFVENYNIRLSSACSKALARSLTKRVRERDGGLPGVEALTLPYSGGRWEVACNLLRPDLASAADVEARAEQWEEDQKRMRQSNGEPQPLVELAYRVGTTAEQCLKALSLATEEERRQHDIAVMEQLKRYVSETT